MYNAVILKYFGCRHRSCLISVFFLLTFLQVTYCVAGFMEKNNDLLYRDLSQCLYACSHPLAKTLFPEGKGVIETILQPVMF